MVTTDTNLGTWGGIFGRRTKHVKTLALELRALIVGLHPEVLEVPRNGDKAVSYGFGKKRNTEAYCYLMPQKDRVNLGFMFGGQLDDPNGLLEGSGKNMRHVKIFDYETACSAKVAHLMHTAIEERRTVLADTPENKAAAKCSKVSKKEAS